MGYNVAAFLITRAREELDQDQIGRIDKVLENILTMSFSSLLCVNVPDEILRLVCRSYR